MSVLICKLYFIPYDLPDVGLGKQIYIQDEYIVNKNTYDALMRNGFSDTTIKSILRRFKGTSNIGDIAYGTPRVTTTIEKLRSDYMTKKR